MSTVFAASPSASSEGHDGLHSRMRLDTQVQVQVQVQAQRQQQQQQQHHQQPLQGHHHQPPPQPQQQDAQSFLSPDSSPFEEIGLSPSSFILVSPEGSIHAHGSDIGAEDWQLMPSPPGRYGAPYTSAAEARQSLPYTAASRSTSAAQQHIPRNLSVASSMSSVAAGASVSHRHSPMSSSPAQPFRRSSPYYAAAAAAVAQQGQQQHQQQTFAESVYRWTTAAPMQTLTSAANDAVYYPNVDTGLGAVPPSHVLPSNTTTAPQTQGPWSVVAPRQARPTPADAMIFAPELNYNYTFAQQGQNPYNDFAAFTSAPESAISPSTQQNPSFATTNWPLTDPFNVNNDPSFTFSTNPDLDLQAGGGVLQRQFSIDPESLSTSDATDSHSRSHLAEDADNTIRQPFAYRPSAMVKVEPETPPSNDDSTKDMYIEQYVPDMHQQSGQQQHVGPIRSHGSRRVGGRALGSKFERDKAERIKERRDHGACWTCSLQRDECSGGDICRRCERRMQRPNADVVLMCDRTRLHDLKGIFVPEILTAPYERKAVESFASLHIARWYKKPIQVPCKLIWGFEPVNVVMYEFVPKDEIIRHSHLAIDNHRAQQTLIESRKSAPLGMWKTDSPDVQMFTREFDDIVDQWLDVFVSRFYSKEEDDFASRLLALMAELGRSDADEHKFLRDVFRLLVITYVLTHAVTIAESQRQECLSQLQSTNGLALPKHCGSKLANRQLKHLFSSIRDTLTDRILKQLQQFLKSSKRYSRWTSAFCAILGLAMAEEQGMQLVHLICYTEAKDGALSERDAERDGVRACEAIDDRFVFVTKLFRLKYHAKFNPLRDHEKESVREHLSARQLDFVRSVASLCAEKGEYLRDRAHVRIAPENAIKYTARLVSQFMLSFWPPT